MLYNYTHKYIQEYEKQACTGTGNSDQDLLSSLFSSVLCQHLFFSFDDGSYVNI